MDYKILKEPWKLFDSTDSRTATTSIINPWNVYTLKLKLNKLLQNLSPILIYCIHL